VVGTILALVAFVTLTTGLITRGMRSGHWPLTNRFEFALCYVWTILAIYLIFERDIKSRSAGGFVVPLALLLVLWAAKRPEADQAIRPLTPALQSGWFPLHVGCSAIAYGSFSVAGGLGLMHLTHGWLGQRGLIAAEESGRLLPLQRNEYLIWRAVGLGFPWLTLGMLTGAIWAQVAWGRYWGWDPKESWTLITWLLFLLILHGRALRGWRGRRVAWLSVLGLIVVWFTYVGVGWLVRTLRLESMHIF
jgi:cytochrome c-type biogenesis protein CcsB